MFISFKVRNRVTIIERCYSVISDKTAEILDQVAT